MDFGRGFPIPAPLICPYSICTSEVDMQATTFVG
jgi:hypothetical protein